MPCARPASGRQGTPRASSRARRRRSSCRSTRRRAASSSASPTRAATTATNAALEASRAAGARTAIITVTDRSPGADLADIVVETGELDQSWCHTVGYLSPMVAAAAVGAHIEGRQLDAGSARRCATRSRPASTGPASPRRLAARLTEARSIVVIASGADRTAGRELVLKIEEGTWLPAAYRDLETFLHGHLAATDDATGLVLVLADRDRRGERRSRGADRGAACSSRHRACRGSRDHRRRCRRGPARRELTPAGRIVVPEAPDAAGAGRRAASGRPRRSRLLTERLARARGVNPDPIHRDVDRYREAADAAGA